MTRPFLHSPASKHKTINERIFSNQTAILPMLKSQSVSPSVLFPSLLSCRRFQQDSAPSYPVYAIVPCTHSISQKCIIILDRVSANRIVASKCNSLRHSLKVVRNNSCKLYLALLLSCELRCIWHITKAVKEYIFCQQFIIIILVSVCCTIRARALFRFPNNRLTTEVLQL